jgi:hypothetical protein
MKINETGRKDNMFLPDRPKTSADLTFHDFLLLDAAATLGEHSKA